MHAHHRVRVDGHNPWRSKICWLITYPVRSQKTFSRAWAHSDCFTSLVHSAMITGHLRKYPKRRSPGSDLLRLSFSCFLSPRPENGWQLNPPESMDLPWMASAIFAMVLFSKRSPCTIGTSACLIANHLQKVSFQSLYKTVETPAFLNPCPTAPIPEQASMILVKASSSPGLWAIKAVSGFTLTQHLPSRFWISASNIVKVG